MKKTRLNIEKKISSSYDICIGSNIEEQIALMIAKNYPAPSLALITDDNVATLHGERFLKALRQVGLNVEIISFPAGELSKNIGTVLTMSSRLLAMGLDRSSKIIALGGGVVGDIAGFVASIYMRGIPYIQIPTTLIAQTDSSIGGKTGIDLSQGKNLLGTFFQPEAVFIDVRFLRTLSDKDFASGMAEVIKYGLIEDEELLSYIEGNIGRIIRREEEVLKMIVESSCRIKKGIVEVDEKEKGVRRILNFGHTVGHAIETISDYKILHGEAVAIGMMVALNISNKRYQMPDSICARAEKILLATGLPTTIPAELDINTIVAVLKMDKKKDGNKINFVLLKNIGMPFINGGVPQEMLIDVMGGMR